uniref:Uncharacterized protein n=1 Tax=Oreochromis aureus TaxID=47969 RepID=A0A668RS75_OREAU
MRLLREEFWACPRGGGPEADPGHAKEITSLSWPGNSSVFPRISWRRCLGKGRSGNSSGNSWRADITAICFPALREERLSLSKQITIGGIAVWKINSFISGDFPQMNFY